MLNDKKKCEKSPLSKGIVAISRASSFPRDLCYAEISCRREFSRRDWNLREPKDRSPNCAEDVMDWSRLYYSSVSSSTASSRMRGHW